MTRTEYSKPKLPQAGSEPAEPETLSKAEDGLYHWIYGLDMRQNRHPFLVLMKILTAVFAVICLILFIPFSRERFLWGLSIVVPCYLVTAAVVYGVFWFLRMLYDDVYYMAYDMDENGIRVREVSDQAEKTQLLAGVIAVSGALTRQYGMMAAGSQLSENSGTYSAFEEVRRVTIDPKHHFIGLNHPFTYNMIYADEPFYGTVRKIIEERCVNAAIRVRN